MLDSKYAVKQIFMFIAEGHINNLFKYHLDTYFGEFTEKGYIQRQHKIIG